MSEFLLVPIHVDALWVGDNGLQLIAPLADFTRDSLCLLGHATPPPTSPSDYIVRAV